MTACLCAVFEMLYIKTRKSLIIRYAILQKTSLFKPFYKIYLADCMSITHENRVVHKNVPFFRTTKFLSKKMLFFFIF